MSQSFRQLVLITSYMTSRKFPFSKSCKQVLPQFLKPLNQFLSSCSLIKINFNQNIEPKCQNTKGAYERKILKIIFLKVRNKNVKFKIVKCCSPLLFFCQKCLSNFNFFDSWPQKAVLEKYYCAQTKWFWFLLNANCFAFNRNLTLLMLKYLLLRTFKSTFEHVLLTFSLD